MNHFDLACWRKAFPICFVACFILFSRCEKKSSTVEKSEVVESDAATVRNSVLGSIHSSHVTKQLIFNSEVFNRGLLNDVDQTNRYLRHGKGVAAINLGIYLSDLSCLVALDKREEARRYFDACLLLSEYIGMKKQFEEAIQFGFNGIIAGEEGLEKSLDHWFKDARNTAEQEEFKRFHASALTGYYIEELHHLASFVKSYSTRDTLDSNLIDALAVFIDQKDELDNLIAHFDNTQLKAKGIDIYQDLLALQTKYLALDSERLLNEKDAFVVLQDKGLLEIFDAINSFRKRIIDS